MHDYLLLRARSKSYPNAVPNAEQIRASVKWRLSIAWIAVLGCAGDAKNETSTTHRRDIRRMILFPGMSAGF
jgi:hypothetical protein